MDHQLRRMRLVARLADLEVEALLVTRQPNVRYLTGYTGSNGQLIVTPGESVFFTDGRYTEQSRHEVPDLERVVYSDGFPQALFDACGRLGVGRVGFESAGVTYKTYEELSLKADGVQLSPVGEEVDGLRWVKEPEELRMIEAAQEATDSGFDAILGKFREGMTEKDLEFELRLAMRAAGADDLAFDTIVAFGESAAEPHHDPGHRPLRRGDIVKLDFGAQIGGYNADMTRTVSFGEPPAELREIYDVVRRAQQAGVDAVHPGVVGKDADLASRRVIEEAGYGERYTHSLGHGIGLEVHEGPYLRRGGEDVVPAGAVVTVEPGIYVPGLGGVRIEDMVEVTEDGCRVVPRSTKELLIV